MQHDIGTHRTTVGHSNGRTFVRYHDTDVVQFDSHWITLNHGGWLTPTTKRRMNQTALAYGLGFTVYQKDHEWFVVSPQGSVVPWGTGRAVTMWRERGCA
jgi:hypothetical protein